MTARLKVLGLRADELPDGCRLPVRLNRAQQPVVTEPVEGADGRANRAAVIAGEERQTSGVVGAGEPTVLEDNRFGVDGVS